MPLLVLYGLQGSWHHKPHETREEVGKRKRREGCGIVLVGERRKIWYLNLNSLHSLSMNSLELIKQLVIYFVLNSTPKILSIDWPSNVILTLLHLAF